MDGDTSWQASPMYLALSARMQQTEATLASLSAQVAQLSNLVRAALPKPSSIPQPPVVFSPFDAPDPSPFIPASPTTSKQSVPPADDNAISLLTQQVSALSTSVTQLQKMQSQSHITRQNSNPSAAAHQPHLTSGPALAASVKGSAGGNGHMNLNQPHQRDFGHARPNIARSISTSVMGAASGGMGDGDKWGNGPPGRMGRDWPSPGPGGLLSPSTSGGAAAGAAFPGAGIVVTKWEHLNLKVELLRSIAKYGIGPPNKIQARVLPFMIKGSDIIAQAPPTQERIISYVVPALQLCLSLPPPGQYRGPAVIIITTTVDQATQCHKLVRNLGGPLGVRSALAAGAAGSSGIQGEIQAIQRDAVHLLVGTPAKVNEVMTRGSLGGADCRLLILDEVDQLIARNLYDHVLSISKLLPSPRRNGNGASTPGGPMTPFSPGVGLGGVTSPYDAGQHSPFNPASKTPFPNHAPNGGSRFGAPGTPVNGGGPAVPGGIERQTCFFSNTIPTDVINFSQSLQVRDPVRVLVRREGGTNSQESVSSVTPGVNIKHTYVYLTITGSARADAATTPSENGPGTIGSGRPGQQQNGQNEEAVRAKEYKLDTLVKMLDDYPLWQAIIHVGTFAMLEAVVYRLNSRNWETLYLSSDMPPAQKKVILQQWRLSIAGSGPRFLVVFDVAVKPPDVPWAPLVINFDLPRSVEGYAHRAAAAVPPTNGRHGAQVNGVIVSFVQAAGGDVEMLRSTECAYRFKSAEIPTVFHDLFQH
ncbi:hypothetical protein BCR39DRAFT_574365 [Naematelia encephala]|uniref:RNA helicase n=1 Tax=Naematelia encephala TaxID=71784 RepID=A0A1Y2B574_9TREE|nr:hypothetical protein BCR39DRAFT_574365 [Naematelia encephala]